VRVTRGLIRGDRKYIAEFNKVQDLKSWLEGTVRTKFSTHKIMSLACERQCTVPTDRAYSLMGMLGVRYPTFSADGLTKALSQLLDEILISSNDVSVFNWTGKQLGSPIRGRSLYPSTLEAFKFQRDERRQREKNKKLAELLQLKRYEMMGVFLNITGMLRDTITFVKDRKQKNLPIGWLREILKVVKEAEFSTLKPHLDNIGKILVYIQKNFNSQSLETAEKDTSKSAISEKPEKAESGSLLSLPFGIRSSLTAFSSPSESMTFRLSSKKSETESSSMPQPSKRSIGGLKSSLGKGFGKKDSGSAKSSSEVDLTSPPSPTLSSVETLTNEPQETHREAKRKQLDEDVMQYIRSIQSPEEQDKSTPASAPELPSELKEVLATITKPEFVKTTLKPEMESMISPNPIIVNNSGIEGVFDIQRVIITMLQPDRLRRQIDNAVSPHQKITGWCTISTGFALVMVSFSCESHILEKQLDVINAIENKVLKEQKDDPTKTRLQRRTTSMSSASKVSEEEPETTGSDDGETEEEKKVSRMIRFVQEPDLDAIAGEWVLARFSGVPGAKWFLCHLELGSTHDYYGHRIPTDEIDFHAASPEMGFAKYWELYMMRKKRKLCGVLEAFLGSKDMGTFKEYLPEFLAEAAGPRDGAESDPELSYLDQGTLALQKLESGLFQKFFEMRAEHLDKTLSASVLKRMPPHLQAALENLNDNKDLLPAMFHSAKKIHMF
jgi:hypothetical protein